jgi:hypothetical protein
MKNQIHNRRFIIIVVCIAAMLSVSPAAAAQSRRKPVKHFTVCGNPNVTCTSAATFEPYDLPFRVPQNAVIYDTEFFYAIILRSVPSPPDNCDNYIPEPDRMTAQMLFVNNKVFTSRCVEPGHVAYTNTNPRTQFMAVYAGLTLAEANRMLAKVKATGKFPGANVRRIRALLNGT